MVDVGLLTRRKRWTEGPAKYHRRSDVITNHLKTLAGFNYAKWHAKQSKFTSKEVAIRVATVAPRKGQEVTSELTNPNPSKIVPFRSA